MIKDIPEILKNNVGISGILRDLSLHTASESTAIFKNDIVRLEGLHKDVAKVGDMLG